MDSVECTTGYNYVPSSRPLQRDCLPLEPKSLQVTLLSTVAIHFPWLLLSMPLRTAAAAEAAAAADATTAYTSDF